MSGQLALVVDPQAVVPAAVWEALSPEAQRLVVVRMARLLGKWLAEETRGER